MAEIAWARKALRHVRQIANYIAKDSPSRAGAMADRLMATQDRLARLPRLGRVVPEFGLDHVRELVTVLPYRIIYVIQEETCHIIAVIHSKRRLRGVLRAEDFEKL